ncbi:MAG: hypothetical protein EP343_26265 [Deltaproteobacteria bacterium]|nr:MAG: hypothetical protein EP343_26265 [Deltaproteobacteria bacterium]
MNYEQLIGYCTQKTGLPSDCVYDAVLDVVVSMLAQEHKATAKFENVQAFLQYLRVAVLRRAFRTTPNRKPTFYSFLQLSSDGRHPEQALLEALEQQSHKARCERLLGDLSGRLHSQSAEEVRQLMTVLLEKPDMLVVRRTGKEKGTVKFNITGLSQELAWSRRKIYDRVEQLRGVARFRSLINEPA